MSPETDIKDFLKRIVKSLFLGLIWLFVNMTLGFYFDLLPIYGRLSTGNVIFYLFLLVSGFFYFRWLYRIWS
jgi:hypothetical protein